MYTPALTALSPLTWGRELKLYLLGGLLIFGKSPLTWGRELKPSEISEIVGNLRRPLRGGVN